MKYKGLKIGVFYEDRPWVEDWFREFIKKVGESCISKCAFTRDKLFVILKDGTQIISYRVTDSARGYRFDKAYVQPTIKKDVVSQIIKPMLFSPKIIIEDF